MNRCIVSEGYCTPRLPCHEWHHMGSGTFECQQCYTVGVVPKGMAAEDVFKRLPVCEARAAVTIENWRPS